MVTCSKKLLLLAHMAEQGSRVGLQLLAGEHQDSHDVKQQSTHSPGSCPIAYAVQCLSCPVQCRPQSVEGAEVRSSTDGQQPTMQQSGQSAPLVTTEPHLLADGVELLLTLLANALS